VVVLRVALATPHNDVAVGVFAETAGSVRLPSIASKKPVLRPEAE